MSISVGTECEALYKGKWYQAKVAKILSGGEHVKVEFKAFKYRPKLPISDVRFSSDTSVLCGTRCDYAVGDKIEAYFQSKWLKAEVKSVFRAGFEYGVEYVSNRARGYDYPSMTHRFTPDKMRSRVEKNLPQIIRAPVVAAVAASPIYPTASQIHAAAAGAVAVTPTVLPTPAAAGCYPSMPAINPAPGTPTAAYPVSATIPAVNPAPVTAVVSAGYPTPTPVPATATVTNASAYPQPSAPVTVIGKVVGYPQPATSTPTSAPVTVIGKVVGYPQPATSVPAPAPAAVIGKVVGYPQPATSAPAPAAVAVIGKVVGYPQPATSAPAPTAVAVIGKVVGYPQPATSFSAPAPVKSTASNYPTPSYPVYPTPAAAPNTTGAAMVYPSISAQPSPNAPMVIGTVVNTPAVAVAAIQRPVNKGDMCEALFKQKWYKARVDKVVDGGKKYKISFLDFSYVPTIVASQVRFPPSL